MFCKYCGAQLDDNAVICPHCGIPTDKFNAQPTPNNTQAAKKTNGMAIAALVVSLIGLFGGGYLLCIPPVIGLVLSILGIQQANRTNGSGRGMAIGSLIVSVISVVFWVIVWIIAIGMIVNDPSVI